MLPLGIRDTFAVKIAHEESSLKSRGMVLAQVEKCKFISVMKIEKRKPQIIFHRVDRDIPVHQLDEGYILPRSMQNLVQSTNDPAVTNNRGEEAYDFILS